LKCLTTGCTKLATDKNGSDGHKVHYGIGFFIKPFSTKKMAVVVPEQEDQDIIHNKLFSEIELGIIKDSTREELLSIVKRMVDKHSIDGLILGCTELSLILNKYEFGIPFLNTTAIHAESIVSYCLGKEA
jgi:aspartate racemase